MMGIRCRSNPDTGNSMWFLPDGRLVDTSTTTTGVHNLKNELVINYYPSFEGMYTCKRNEAQVLIGLYHTTTNGW